MRPPPGTRLYSADRRADARSSDMSRLFARKAGESRPGEPADPTADTAVLPAPESPRDSAGEPPVGEPVAEPPATSDAAAKPPTASDAAAKPPPASEPVAEPVSASGAAPTTETAVEHQGGATDV